MHKISYPIDKNEWCPSLIPGPIVLISTYDAEGNPNVAPKSWLQMVSFKPTIVMFSGSKGFTTETNILATGCFGVNLVDASMADRVYGCLQWFGRERIERAGFKLVAAPTIHAPLVDDCKAHLECVLRDTHEVGSGFVIFGEIVAAAIWDEILKAAPEERYARFDQVVFLENGTYARIDRALRVRQVG
jgi:flavin reductase (DIM6/NTAB) family NADH-FMN oxidoreductase RutF